MRIVQHQGIARAVVAHIAAEGIILVPSLGLIARREIVAVAMAVEGVPRPQNTGQGRIYCRVGEQLVQQGNALYQVVARIARSEHAFDLAVQFAV